MCHAVRLTWVLDCESLINYIFVWCLISLKFIYLFLVEKAVCHLVCLLAQFLRTPQHIIRGTAKRRLQSKLYIFNSFGMLGVYIVVVILNFVLCVFNQPERISLLANHYSRITRMEHGQCIIGMKSVAMIPLISFDVVVNVYLTIMFLIPLKSM